MKKAFIHRIRQAKTVTASALFISCAVTVGSLVFGTGCISRLFYYPDQRIYETPARLGLRFEEVEFASADGTRLAGWFVPAQGRVKGTVIHFHGNAQNMSAHFAYVNWLPAEGYNVFTFDYRGYGRSGGKPQREGIYNDCIAALRYIQTRVDVDPERLLVLGQSLGGANALAVLGRNHFPGIKAVAIDSTFYSYRSIVRDKIGEIPLLWIAKWPLSFLVINNRYSPGPVVNNLAAPVVLIHGTADRVIPYHHSQKLFEKALAPKELWTITNGGHTDALIDHGTLYRKRLIDFFNNVQ